MAERVGGQPVAAGDDDAVEAPAARRAGIGHRLLRALGGQLALEGLHLLAEPLDPAGELLGLDPQRAGRGPNVCSSSRT